MPANRFSGVPILIGCVLGLACEVQDQGLATPLPAASGAPDGGRPPSASIDPPTPPPAAPPPDAAPPVPEPVPVPPIDEPTAIADAGAEAIPPDAPPASATNCAALSAGPFQARLRSPIIQSDELTFDLQGRMLLIQGDDVIRMGDGMSEVLLRGVLGSQGGALQVLADGSLAVADFTSDEVTRYNLASRSQVSTMDTDSPMKIALGPQSRL
jgi:hypothetical protein